MLFVTLLASQMAHAQTSMVWSQSDSQGINVYFSGNAKEIIAVTGSGINVSPNLFRSRNSTWLTWVDKSTTNANQLKFSQRSDGGKIIRSGSIPGAEGDLYAPAISIDTQARRVWLVWARFNGRTENLYASYLDLERRANGKWATPLQITPNDQYSANLPVITNATYASINVDWMRTSASVSENASAIISASSWQMQTAMQGVAPADANTANYRSLSVRAMRRDDRLIKRLGVGQALSVEEAGWQRLVRNRKALSGAVHSGVGASQRLVEVQR